MGRAGLVVLLLSTPVMTGADCGTPCVYEPDPAPMSSARAKEIEPTLESGLAVSTTHIYGDCRAAMPEFVSECGSAQTARCVRARKAFRVLVLPANLSIPMSQSCPGGFAVGDLAVLAVVDAESSALGELIIPLEIGGYAVFASLDGVCAECGLGLEACVVQIERGGVATRDLVLDEATH